MIKLETEKLRAGIYYARPQGTLGTCGWSPFPWRLCGGRSSEHAKREFLRVHRKYLEQ